MPLQQTMKLSAVNTTSLHRDSVSAREDVWFDNINKFLYLDFRKTCATCIRIATWNNGLFVERWSQVLEIWESEEWDTGIPLPLPKAWMIFSLDEFYKEIPPEVIRLVAPFKWRQFVLLRLIRHCPEAFELLQSNPVLAWVCADVIARREIPAKQARKILQSKRRDICAFAGLPATESMVRILAKMSADEYTDKLFNNLQDVIRDQDRMSRLRFFKKIPFGEMSMLLQRFDFLAWALSTSDRNGTLVWDAMNSGASNIGSTIWCDMPILAHSAPHYRLIRHGTVATKRLIDKINNPAG